MNFVLWTIQFIASSSVLSSKVHIHQSFVLCFLFSFLIFFSGSFYSHHWLQLPPLCKWELIFIAILVVWFQIPSGCLQLNDLQDFQPQNNLLLLFFLHHHHPLVAPDRSWSTISTASILLLGFCVFAYLSPFFTKDDILVNRDYVLHLCISSS